MRKERKKKKAFESCSPQIIPAPKPQTNIFFISFIYKLRGGWKCVLQMLFVFDNFFFQQIMNDTLPILKCTRNVFFIRFQHSLFHSTYSHLILFFSIERGQACAVLFSSNPFFIARLFLICYFSSTITAAREKKSRKTKQKE